MRQIVMVAFSSVLLALPVVVGTHDAGCVPTSADPATYSVVVSPDGGRTFYVEERDASLALPGLGAATGAGTWVYEEVNGIPGLQRGGIGLMGEEDPVDDETCGHGPDADVGGVDAKPLVCAGSYTIGATVTGPKGAWANTELYCTRADGTGSTFITDCKAEVLAVPDGETVGTATCEKSGSFSVDDRVKASCDHPEGGGAQKPKSHKCTITA